MVHQPKFENKRDEALDISRINSRRMKRRAREKNLSFRLLLQKLSNCRSFSRKCAYECSKSLACDTKMNE